ncbi:AsmA family protein [Sinomicrobium sp. M5D2P17]
MKISKTFKRAGIVLLTFFAVMSIVIAIALNFIFTPEKITPEVVRIINENIHGEVDCESIELTFFSSFPRFGVRLKNGAVLPPAHSGSGDTLAAFNDAQVTLNMYKLLAKNELHINNIRLYRPDIHAMVDSLGNPNWDVLGLVTDTIPTDTTESDFSFKKIVLKNLEIQHGNLLYEDGLSKNNYRVQDFNFRVKAVKGDKGLFLNTHNKSDNISMYKDGGKPYQIKNITIISTLFYDQSDRTIHIKESDFSLNDIHFSTKGQIQLYPERQELSADLETRLVTNSFKNIVELIPPHILHNEKIDTEGKVDLQLTVNGLYGKDHQPRIDAILHIDHASLAYSDFPGKIEDMSVRATSVLFPDGSAPSSVTIDHLRVNGTGVHIDASGNIEHLFENAVFDIALKSNIHFTEFYTSFPVDENIKAKGNIEADLKTNFKLNDLTGNHYENINLIGNLQFDDVDIDSPKDSLWFRTRQLQTSFFQQKNERSNMAGNVDIRDARLVYKNDLDFTAEELTADLKVDQQGEKKVKLDVTMGLKTLKFTSKSDSLRGIVKKANVEARLFPEEDGKAAYITSRFTIDSAALRQKKDFVAIKQGNYVMRLDKKAPKKWTPKGHVNFHRLIAYSPKMGVPLKMPASRISFENDNITLDHAKFHFGHSDATLTGNIQHLKGFKSGDPVTAILEVDADFIDANQLMQVFSSPPDEVVDVDNMEKIDQEVATDALKGEKHTFKIPDNLRFTLNTNINRLKFGDMDMRNIYGRARIKEGRMKLEDFHLNTLAAQLQADISYSAKTNKEADLDFRLYLSNIEMDQIHRVFPVLDSLFPMTRSFEGKADFRLKGNAKLSKDMDIKIPTLKGIAALKAHDIMVLDGPTFSDLAKTFMFKNKEKNPIKELNMEMTFEESHLEILPALLEIDRYQLAVGGIQNLDMSYDYHISVLKSPVPFKTGVDVTGNFDDYDISLLNKAKYKYYFSNKERLLKKADSLVINRKSDILDQLDFN